MIKATNPFKFLEILNTYDYGMIVNGEVIKGDIDWSVMWEYYRTVSPSEFETKRIGVCWDYTAYEAYYFKEFFDFKFKTYYLELDNDMRDTHTFLVYEDSEFHHIESSFWKLRGIHNGSLESIFDKVLEKMFKGNQVNFTILEYTIDKYNLGTLEFMEYVNTHGVIVPHVYKGGGV